MKDHRIYRGIGMFAFHAILAVVGDSGKPEPEIPQIHQQQKPVRAGLTAVKPLKIQQPKPVRVRAINTVGSKIMIVVAVVVIGSCWWGYYNVNYCHFKCDFRRFLGLTTRDVANKSDHPIININSEGLQLIASSEDDKVNRKLKRQHAKTQLLKPIAVPVPPMVQTVPRYNKRGYDKNDFKHKSTTVVVLCHWMREAKLVNQWTVQFDEMIPCYVSGKYPALECAFKKFVEAEEKYKNTKKKYDEADNQRIVLEQIIENGTEKGVIHDENRQEFLGKLEEAQDKSKKVGKECYWAKLEQNKLLREYYSIWEKTAEEHFSDLYKQQKQLGKKLGCYNYIAGVLNKLNINEEASFESDDDLMKAKREYDNAKKNKSESFNEWRRLFNELSLKLGYSLPYLSRFL